MIHKDFALIGATGRVGRLVTQAWKNSLGPVNQIPFQTRNKDLPASPLHIPWDIADGSGPLEEWMNIYGRLSCLIVLSGTTPATGTNMYDNVTLAQSYTQVAHKLEIPRILIASSSAVYGSGSRRPFVETDPCVPINAYGQSKQMMEESLKSYVSPDRDVCCLRIGNILGADALFLNAKRGERIELDTFEDGKGPIRSYIGPTNFAHVLERLATCKSRLPFTLNVAAPFPVYMDDLARAANLNWTRRPASDAAIQTYTLNCDKLARFVQLPTNASDTRAMVNDLKRISL